MNDVKILSVDDLAEKVRSFKETGKTVVHCHGVFDLLHIGHIRYFEKARELGDVLIVTVTPDRFVDKGPDRPAFPEILRAEAIASLSCVDYVAINEWPTAEETLRLIQPDYYVKGSEFKETASDMTGKIGKEQAVVDEIGARLAFTEDIVFSSSNLINRYLVQYPDELREYLNLFRSRYDLQQLLDMVDRMESLKVLVVGDAIIDDYRYCEALGKSSKDPILAMKYQSHELFAGGALAVANHAANFAASVDVLTVIGAKKSHEEFIRQRLMPNVTPHFVVKPDSPTTVKRRFVDGYTMTKLFEVYIMDDDHLPTEQDEEACAWLREHIAAYDVVIAADFGHGAVSPTMIGTMTEAAPFLAVMTQANAGNRGFHTVTLYPRADYICIAEHEIRLETRDVRGSLMPMVEALAEKVGCERFVVTRGRKGCLVWSRAHGFLEIPTFAQKAVDRVGAGDAFLSVTSLAACQGASDELVGFLGNVVGSMAVGFIGNVKSIDKMSAKKYITSLMK